MTIDQSAEGLKEVNRRVIDIHLVVSNSYILLGTLPLDWQWYTVLNLKDMLFSLPLTQKPALLALEWKDPEIGVNGKLT